MSDEELMELANMSNDEFLDYLDGLSAEENEVMSEFFNSLSMPDIEEAEDLV